MMPDDGGSALYLIRPADASRYTEAAYGFAAVVLGLLIEEPEGEEGPDDGGSDYRGRLPIRRSHTQPEGEPE